MADRDTQQKILDVATQLVQTRGFNGFSYADIAEQLAVTKATLHYHFPSKADLGRALIERYQARFLAALDDIDRTETDAPGKLRRYADIYAGVLADERMCLCGMLAAQFGTLPAPMTLGLKGFFDANEKWLAALLEEGRAQRRLRFDGPPLDVARLLVGSLEGAMMLARSYAEPSRFRLAADRLLSDLCVAASADAPRAARRSAVRR